MITYYVKYLANNDMYDRHLRAVVTLHFSFEVLALIAHFVRSITNVPGYVCNPGSPRERDAASKR